jgi:DNA repair protein RadC
MLNLSEYILRLIHRHPTGDPSPSSDDISITRRLKEGGEIKGIKVLDHIIIGDGHYLSFVEKGFCRLVKLVKYLASFMNIFWEKIS